MPVHGGVLAARTLKHAGIEVVFTLAGGHIMPLYDGCIDEGIKIVDVRHEQAAVHAADAWARCNPGGIGVAAITAGPGVTDGVTGVANASESGTQEETTNITDDEAEPTVTLAVDNATITEAGTDVAEAGFSTGYHFLHSMVGPGGGSF